MEYRPAWLAHLPLFLLVTSRMAGAAAPLSYNGENRIPYTPTRDAFYCQEPDYSMIYNMSSGFDAEIADDIPVEFVGEQVGEVTLWLGEWYSVGGPQWTDPVGVRLNFYHQSCPPELDSYRTIEVLWGELEKTLVLDGTGSTVYEIYVPVSPPLQVEEGMSLGTTALIDWGQQEPFTGICATPFYVSFGACVAYLDGENWGYHRWSAIDHYTGIPQDLAYCLSAGSVGVPQTEANRQRIRVSPNPFLSQTTLHHRLSRSGPVVVRVYDVAGRWVATLLDGRRAAGRLSVHWPGRDDSGRRVSAGVYVITLETADGRQSARLILLAD